MADSSPVRMSPLRKIIRADSELAQALDETGALCRQYTAEEEWHAFENFILVCFLGPGVPSDPPPRAHQPGYVNVPKSNERQPTIVAMLAAMNKLKDKISSTAEQSNSASVHAYVIQALNDQKLRSRLAHFGKMYREQFVKNRERQAELLQLSPDARKYQAMRHLLPMSVQVPAGSLPTTTSSRGPPTRRRNRSYLSPPQQPAAAVHHQHQHHRHSHSSSTAPPPLPPSTVAAQHLVSPESPSGFIDPHSVVNTVQQLNARTGQYEARRHLLPMAVQMPAGSLPIMTTPRQILSRRNRHYNLPSPSPQQQHNHHPTSSSSSAPPPHPPPAAAAAMHYLTSPAPSSFIDPQLLFAAAPTAQQEHMLPHNYGQEAQNYSDEEEGRSVHAHAHGPVSYQEHGGVFFPGKR
ncbi:hypothetical protein JCM10908_002698 [Rhodotorula pacifica]|uniref:uncharacterized protein n=1 Tax=Rhodotorula pacifica TaxID=1495444 RepID=UPI00317891CA